MGTFTKLGLQPSAAFADISLSHAPDCLTVGNFRVPVGIVDRNNVILRRTGKNMDLQVLAFEEMTCRC